MFSIPTTTTGRFSPAVADYFLIYIQTLNTLLCFYDMGNGGLPVEKLESTYEYIVNSSFDEMYMIRKLKQKNVCSRIIDGMRWCGQVTYEKQLQTALKEEGVDL